MNPLRQCRPSDFETKGLIPGIKMIEKMKRMLCPDFYREPSQDPVMVKNLYTSDERTSFFLLAAKCSKDINPNCKEDEREVTRIIENSLIDVYVLFERAQLSTHDKANLTNTVIEFHSQFTLDLTRYRDNNNFIRVNQMQAQDDRWTFFKYKRTK